MSCYIYNKKDIPAVNNLIQWITHLWGQHPDTVIHMPEDIHGCDEPLQLALRELLLLMSDNAEIAYDLLTAAYESRHVEYVKNGRPGDYFSAVGGVRYAIHYFKKVKLLEENIRAGRLDDTLSSHTLQRDRFMAEESTPILPDGPTTPQYPTSPQYHHYSEPSTPVRSPVRPRSPSFCPNSPVFTPKVRFKDQLLIWDEPGSSAAEASYDQRNGARKRARPSEDEEGHDHAEDEETNQRAKRPRYQGVFATGDEEVDFPQVNVEYPQHRATPRLWTSAESLASPFPAREQTPPPPPEESRESGQGLLEKFKNVFTQADENFKTMSSLRRKAKEYKAKAKARKREVKAYKRLLNAYKLEAEADKMEISALRKKLKL